MAEKKKSKKKSGLGLLGRGLAKLAGIELKTRKSKLDKRIKASGG